MQVKPGAPGFEPGIAGPKPAALPLGYAPSISYFSLIQNTVSKQYAIMFDGVLYCIV